MGVRKCPKCGSVWYTALPKCAFCGVEGEEVKGPISPAKLNLGKRGIEAGPPPGHSASDRDLAPSAEPTVAAEEPPKAEQPPPPPPPPPEPPKEAPPEPPKPEPPPVKIETPAPLPPPPPEPPPPPRPERSPALRPVAARVEPSAPAPQIPSSTVPLVFGWLGLVAAVLLPLTTVVRNDKVLVTFALLAWAILAQFAPWGWYAAQRYADQCRLLGFAPAPSAHTGKVLGRLATFLLVVEFSALAVFIVFQVLSGKIVCPLWK